MKPRRPPVSMDLPPSDCMGNATRRAKGTRMGSWMDLDPSSNRVTFSASSLPSPTPRFPRDPPSQNKLSAGILVLPNSGGGAYQSHHKGFPALLSYHLLAAPMEGVALPEAAGVAPDVAHFTRRELEPGSPHKRAVAEEPKRGFRRRIFCHRPLLLPFRPLPVEMLGEPARRMLWYLHGSAPHQETEKQPRDLRLQRWV